MASDGGGLGRWRARPQGCTLDRFDGLPANRSSSVVAFVWADPALGHPLNEQRYVRPDAPLRLEISHAGSESAPTVVADLHTLRKAGVRLDANVCTTLRFNAAEHGPGRPTLAGTLDLDCTVDRSHITATLQFEHCAF